MRSVVVVLMGLPASGKTTLADVLGPMIPARLVSRDAVRAALFKPCSFSEREKAAAFEAVVSAVAVNCELGHSTIVDGMPFSRVGEYEAVRDAGAARTAFALPVLCTVPVDVARERVRRQDEGAGHAAQDRDEDLVNEVADRFRSPPEGTLELDGTRPAEELARRVLERVRALERAPRLPSSPPPR